MKCQITLSPCRCSGGPLFVFSLSLTAKLKVLEGSTYVLLALVLCHQCCKIMHFTQQTFLILARHKRGSVSFFLFSFTPLLQWWFPVPNPFTVFPKETTVSQRERERERQKKTEEWGRENWRLYEAEGECVLHLIWVQMNLSLSSPWSCIWVSIQFLMCVLRSTNTKTRPSSTVQIPSSSMAVVKVSMLPEQAPLTKL